MSPLGRSRVNNQNNNIKISNNEKKKKKKKKEKKKKNDFIINFKWVAIRLLITKK